MKVNNVINLFLLLSLLGTLDALYLTWSHFQGGEVGCLLVEGCDVVLKSEYAELFRVPVAFGGVIYYFTIFFSIFLYNLNRSILLLKRISLFTIVGFVASLWFLYLQKFAIGAYCTFCLISATLSTLLFILGMYILKKLDSTSDEMVKSQDLN